MRRVLAIAAAVGIVGLGASGALMPAHAGGTYRVDVVFDDAHGLIPGQLAQIAGARVGTIKDVKLTPDFRARVQLEIQSKYAPFKKDATCTIRPQGLIAENYVNCETGSPDAPPLKAIGDNAPTVPIEQTTAPVPVTDLFEIWDAPVRDRLTLLVNALGIGTAGRGEGFNEILRRANPSLELARKVIAVLHRQRSQLATILDRGDEIFGGLAANRGRVADFLDEAAATTSVTGAHSRQLEETVRRLPPLLAAADPALRDLDKVVRTGTPLVRKIREAAPALNAISRDIGPFAREAQPTLAKLRPVLVKGTSTLKRSAPVTRIVRTYARNSLDSALIVGPLFQNLRDRGFVENFLTTLYRAAAATARFDATSHILPAFVTLNTCAVPATTPVSGCSANFTNATPAARRSTPRKPSRTGERPAARPSAPEAQAPAATPAAPKPLLPSNPVDAVKGVIDSLLHPGASGGGRESTDDGVGKLLGYLLG